MTVTSRRRVLFTAAILMGCEGTTKDTVLRPDAGATPVDGGLAFDANEADATFDGAMDDAAADAGDSWLSATESEPNGGASLKETNAITPSTRVMGEITDAEDADVFELTTEPGHVYLATIRLPPSGGILPHLAVMDAGRGSAAPGEDYVKIASPGWLQWVAMGVGNYYVIVRDARNVGAGDRTGAGLYQLEVSEVALDEVLQAPLSDETISGALDGPGAVALYAFDGSEGDDVRFDLQSETLDAKLTVYSVATSDWIARSDDRTVGDPNPLIDAPLTASGAMYLVVENLELAPAGTQFTLNATLP